MDTAVSSAIASTPAHRFGGILSALVTPYRPDLSVDLDRVPGLIGWQLAQGVQGFYVGGSTGEAFVQSTGERAAMLVAVARAAQARVTQAQATQAWAAQARAAQAPVGQGRCVLLAHVGAISTAETLVLARAAADAGYDAVSAIPPFYYGFTVAELAAHYAALAAATPLPVIVYNFAGRNALGTADILRLLDDKRVIGVKHTSTDLYALERFKRHRPDAVIYNGFDEMCLAGLAMGADGAIGTTYNVIGAVFVALRDAFAAGRNADALALQRRANQVIDVLIDVGVFPGTKGLLSRLGQDCGGCRPPFRPLGAADWSKLEACLDVIRPETKQDATRCAV